MFTKSFKPLVSIIVPVYNAEKHLNRCLDSLVSQTLKRLEIICVNDGSKDNSLDILLQYSQKFPNIIVFNQENSGPGIARNKALENANGKYIIFCDSDDTLDVNTCLECYNLMETHKIDIIIFNYNVFDVERIEMSTKESFGNGKDMLLVNSKTEGILNKFNTIKFSSHASIWGYFYRFDLIKKHNMRFENYMIAEDNIFFLSYLMVINNGYALNKTFYNYFSHKDSLADKAYRTRPWLNRLFLLPRLIFNTFCFAKKNRIIHKHFYIYLWFVYYLNSRLKR